MQTVLSQRGGSTKNSRQTVRTRRSTTRSRLLMDVLEQRLLLSLPAGWANIAIANTSQGGSASGSANASNGVFTVTGNGNGYQYGFEYAYRTVTGDFDAKMRVTGLTGASQDRTGVGLMLREGITFASRQALNGAWNNWVDTALSQPSK